MNAWVKYNTVDFGRKKIKKVEVTAKSENGGTFQVRLNGVDGPVIAEVTIPKSTNWSTVEVKVSKLQSGVQNLVLVLEDSPVEIDWIQFR
jgi:hypothetical protein